LYRTKPDNRIELTDEGSMQAKAAGQRIKSIIGEEAVDMYISPWQRTLQTSRNVLEAFPPEQIKHIHIDPRLREQEFGNLQGDDFKKFREEQQNVGRFWYRFPTGESGSDVYDRAAAWWHGSVVLHNWKPDRDRVDNIIVVTHGLTMRLILMQLFGWSPDTFPTVWNAGNCEMYVLKADPNGRGRSSYYLDEQEGDSIRSTCELLVHLTNGQEKTVVLTDYLSIPPPRTTQIEVVKSMLEKQHGISPDQVANIDFFAARFKKYK
jgi:broad specificity phosphatase PhoE